MWRRPPQDSDKLYMNVGEGDLIEVGHPQPKPGQEDPRLDNVKNDTCFFAFSPYRPRENSPGKSNHEM